MFTWNNKGDVIAGGAVFPTNGTATKPTILTLTAADRLHVRPLFLLHVHMVLVVHPRVGLFGLGTR